MMNKQKSKGQALVEMAIITPILLFMLIGMFEVGWALRGYLVIVNINREITRRAIRPNYLDFSNRPDPYYTPISETIGYKKSILSFFGDTEGNLDKVKTTFAILPNPTLPTALLEKNAYLTISYFVVQTGLPVQSDKPCTQAEVSSGTCCQSFETAVNDIGTKPAKDLYQGIAKNFTYDDIIVHPDLPLYDYYTYTTYTDPTSRSDWTRIDDNVKFANPKVYEEYAYQLALDNALFNCKLLHKSNTDVKDKTLGESINPSNNNVLMTELYYEQPQLLGFPLLSIGNNSLGVPVTDPINMYSQTSMRLQSSTRKQIDPTTTGPICAPLPIIASANLLAAAPVAGPTGNPINILVNGGPQWVRWGDIDVPYTDEEYFKYQLEYPQMALNERDDVLDARNGTQSVTVWNFDATASAALKQEIETIISGFADQEVIIPVITGGKFKGAAVVVLDGNVDLNPPPNPITGDPVDPYITGYLRGGAVDECRDPTWPPPN